jgi:predicted dehydrogenase
MKHLIIGGGSIGKRHLRNLFSIGEKNLFCMKRSPDSNFEDELKCRVVCTESEVLELKPDVIYVCNPTSLHEYAVKLADQVGAHIFMEKPLTHDEESLKRLLARKAPGKIFFIGFMLRYHPLVAQLKSIIEQKVAGEIYGARFEFGSFLPYWHPWEDHRTGYAGRKDQGGGVVNTITHELDLILHLFGEPDAVTAITKNPGFLDIDVEEMVEAVFEYPGRLINLHLDFLQKDYDRQIRLLCTEGKITWNWHTNEIIIDKHKSTVETIKLKSFDVNQLYIDELTDFLKLVKGEKTENPLDFNYSLINTEWMLAMHHSSKNGRKWEK